MDAFSFLKYWRGSGGGATIDGGGANVRTLTSGPTTLVTALRHAEDETEGENNGDDGPFFDLEFAVPEEDDGDEEVKREVDGCLETQCGEVETESDGENEFRFTLSSGSSGDRTDLNAAMSPSDDLFFKGSLFPVETSSIVLNGSDLNHKNQFSLLKSATKLRVLMLKLKKPRAEKTEIDGSASPAAKMEETHQQKQQKKMFTVKLRVEDVPIVSLLIRDNSSRANSGGPKPPKPQSSDESASDEKKLARDVMQRYLKMVKPLYVRGSKRYGEKMKLSGHLNLGKSKAGKPPPSTPEQKSPQFKEDLPESGVQPLQVPSNGQKKGNLTAGLREVCKHLGKSRSASSVAAAETPPGSTQTMQRRDDSLLQQQDGIQSAILHCKRSFNAPRDSESSLLSRSVSDPSHDKSTTCSTKCLNESGV